MLRDVLWSSKKYWSFWERANHWKEPLWRVQELLKLGRESKSISTQLCMKRELKGWGLRTKVLLIKGCSHRAQCRLFRPVGAALIWGGCSWSGQSSATCAQWGQRPAWIWVTRLFHQWIFFFPDVWSIFQDDNAGFHQAHAVEVFQHEHLIFTHGSASTEWRPSPHPDSGMGWRLFAVVRLSHRQYKMMVKNECNTGQKLILRRGAEAY